MGWLPGFDLDEEAAPLAVSLGPRLRKLASRGIYLGTSSWKYPGWLGSVYVTERYQNRGRFSETRFNDQCLTEYARVFPIVCGDFSFYTFPSVEHWQRLFQKAPNQLLFAFKVPEEITVPLWPSHPRLGLKSGRSNENFLNATLFKEAFTQSLIPYKSRIPVIIFEFGTISKQVCESPETFSQRLDQFLGQLPQEFRYAIEIRNSDYLKRSYFDMLAKHGVAHVFNAWTRMPPMETQLALPGSMTTNFSVARALLSPGATYEQAVQRFSPYQRTQMPDLSTRQALRQLLEGALENNRPTYLFVNNRLEGHAPSTIEALVDMTEVDSGK